VRKVYDFPAAVQSNREAMPPLNRRHSLLINGVTSRKAIGFPHS
jgi:hypothetical protein